MNLAGLVYHKSFIHDESFVYLNPKASMQEENEISGSGPMYLAGLHTTDHSIHVNRSIHESNGLHAT